MEIRGIDVSSYQGKPDWTKTAEAGIRAAILRIHQKNGVDVSFEYNYRGCKENGILTGGYKFSYALTTAEAEKEAEDTLDVLNGRRLDFPVFYDLEYSRQRALGREKITAIAKAFLDKVKTAGYKTGIYCNMDWYRNVLDTASLDYDYWLARYPSGDTGELQERLRVPADMAVGWQYSSKGKVPGISGNVDMDVFYTDYSSGKDAKEDTKTADTDIFKTADEVISALIDIAEKEIGYLEKKSASSLDSKTGNAGNKNYTKYWRDAAPSYQGQPWCAGFISWIMMTAFGTAAAKKLLRHWPYVYCPMLGQLFTKHAGPEKGDIVIFYRNGTFVHTGLVTRVSGDRFWTIEGNTSGESGIIANGGGVWNKSYYNSQLPGTKFCRPDYSIVIGARAASGKEAAAKAEGKYMFDVGNVQSGSSGNDVKLLQRLLKSNGFKGADGKNLSIDGEAGANTVYAIRAYQRKKGLTADGIAGPATWKDILLR